LVVEKARNQLDEIKGIIIRIEQSKSDEKR